MDRKDKKGKIYPLNESQLENLPSPDEDGFHTIPVKFQREGDSLKIVELLGRNFGRGKGPDSEDFDDRGSDVIIGLQV